MIQLQRSGLALDSEDIPALRSEFQAKHCLRLPMLLEPDLLGFLDPRLQNGLWNELVHDGIGVEQILGDRSTLSLLHFLSNEPAFRQLIQKIAACDAVTIFRGRVYRMIPNEGHYDSWHDDNKENRAIGMSLNLSPRVYRGGAFQLRERGSDRVLIDIANTGFGDAIIFKISSELEHRVSKVEGNEPKTAFAGWFSDEDQDFFSRLREKAELPCCTS